MANVYVLFWFDVEDCTVPQSDDAAKRLAWILEKHGVRGTMKVVGQKARVLEQRVRYDVIDALKEHDIGFHSNWHGLRPQIAEYLAPLGWDEGAAEFEAREGPGLADVERVLGARPVTYGQPGCNWAPQAFPVLRRWGIPTYVSGFGYVGLDCQPFWYGGLLCTSHMYGNRLDGREESHFIGLNFELGGPGELDRHKELFSRSLSQLSGSGGLISLLNHPCTLVLEEWFSTYMKPRELTEAGYVHFEDFLAWALSFSNVRTTCASDLPRLYPDRAAGHVFSREELAHIASNLAEAVSFQVFDGLSLSAAEAFGLLSRCLAYYAREGALPERLPYSPVFNPTQAPGSEPWSGPVAWDAFCEGCIGAVVGESPEEGEIGRGGAVPNTVSLAPGKVAPADFLAALAGVVARLDRGDAPPEEVHIRPVEQRFEAYVDEADARASWSSAMMPKGFAAPRLIELAKLGAWTLKPAILRPA